MIYESQLYHHGIKGQKWGKRNGPPYPLENKHHTAVKSRWKDEPEGESISLQVKRNKAEIAAKNAKTKEEKKKAKQEYKEADKAIKEGGKEHIQFERAAKKAVRNTKRITNSENAIGWYYKDYTYKDIKTGEEFEPYIVRGAAFCEMRRQNNAANAVFYSSIGALAAISTIGEYWLNNKRKS